MGNEYSGGAAAWGEGAEAGWRRLPGLAEGNCNGGFLEKAQDS